MDAEHFLMERALRGCARRGERRVAIYGAGAHTRRMGPALCEPPLEIVGIVDDDPMRIGSRMWNFPVISPEEARDVDAVIISSDSAETAIWERCAGLRGAGVEVIRLYGPNDAGDVPQQIAVWPPVTTPTEWGDLAARLAWYLAPAARGIESVFVPQVGLTAPSDASPIKADSVPSYLIRPSGSPLDDRIRFVDPESLDDLDPDLVLIWNDRDDARGLARPGRAVVSVDPISRRYSSMAFGSLANRVMGGDPAAYELSKKRFARFVSESRADRTYVFGTGPSLARAREMHFDDGVCLVCNSIVADDELMARLRPALVAFADPVFHMGPSSYAAEFRDHLVRSVRAHGCWIAIPMRDFRVLSHHLPDDVAGRLIGVPTMSGAVPRLDLTERFATSETTNILTMLLLPIAATISRWIGVVGCDGRPIDQNEYFWSHDRTAQLPDRMNDARRAHPGFFEIDYRDYYAEHCATVERWLDEAARRGIRVESLTPSFIPALAERGMACAG